MPAIANIGSIVYEENHYVIHDKTQCVALVQQTTTLPRTAEWKAGIKVKDAKAGDILRGTAIATFTAEGKYPSGDTPGRHAALYLSHDATGIKVIDQWVGKATPAERTIRYKGEATSGWQNNGDYYYVIETGTP